MMSKSADSIRRGLEEAVAYAEGTADAGRFGFSIKTLRHWEQKQRVPEGPARAYLLVIDRDPEAVKRALSKAASPCFEALRVFR